MTSRQEAICEFLKESDAGELALVFEAGARFRNDATFPARSYFAAHAAREVITKLDLYHSATRNIGRTKKPTQFRDLANKWSAAVAPHLGRLQRATPPLQGELVPIPLALATSLNKLIEYETGVKEMRRRTFAVLLGAIRNMPAAQMHDIAGSFLDIEAHAYAHVPAPAELHNESDALRVWDQVEERFFALIAPRHEIYRRIEASLEELNSL